MKILNNVELNSISGGDVNVGLLMPVQQQDINFSNGFNAGVDLVGGIAGFLVGVPCAFIILPARGIYHLGVEGYNWWNTPSEKIS